MTDAENRPSLFKRLLLGAAIVILASASATAFAAFCCSATSSPRPTPAIRRRSW
jgi:hypothetical protein